MNQDVLKQYGLLSLEVMKRHVSCIFGDDATLDDVPASNAMNIADITPHSDNDHKKIFYNRM
eukprot:12670348-Ditylum_brightwellii.AAC.1